MLPPEPSEPVIVRLFHEAAALEPDERDAFLRRRCASNEWLRARLQAALAHDNGDTEESLPVVNVATGGASWGPQTVVGQRQIDDRVKPQHTISSPLAYAEWIRPGGWIGHYELIRKLGSGGMGMVYLARDTRLGRLVAIKLLQTCRRALTERFLQEAQATARCPHDNIVTIHEVGKQHGVPFMVLEFLPGKDLKQLLDGCAIPYQRAIELVLPVVKALAYAHNRGIVHRDLKPANILQTNTGAIKVLDFGLAKFLSEAELGDISELPDTFVMTESHMRDTVTPPGTIMGTCRYMSPEQWSNPDGIPIDRRTDIWSLGIILFEMVTGRHPLAPLVGRELVKTAVLDQPMPSIKDACIELPDDLAKLIDDCLRKRRHQRIQSASELAIRLEALVPGQTGRELAEGESPYPGLSSFQQSDSDRFFGRDHDIAYALAQLRDQPLMAIVGPSGVGKSSFIRAGLIPALQHTGENWQPLIIRPGRHPVWALATTLQAVLEGEASSSKPYATRALYHRLRTEPGYMGRVLRDTAGIRTYKYLVFIDQFEELFTLSREEAEHRLFIQCLAGIADDPSSPLRVVLSIRSDFIDRVAVHRELMANLAQGLIFLPPPDRAGLREALTKPAAMRHYRFENENMVDAMLDALVETPGALPLLQFAAIKLWEMRDIDQRLLTQQSYDAIGGVAGALASHADQIVNQLSPREQVLVRTIFLRLITPERTRAIASIDELHELSEHSEDIQRLLDYLVNARLLVVQSNTKDHRATTIEIVHEAMIHRWPRLTMWLDEHQEDAAFMNHLGIAARQWQTSGRPAGMLWRGDVVADARRRKQRCQKAMSRIERQFLQAVFDLADRTVRRKRRIVIGIICFLSLVIAAGTVLLGFVSRAEKQATSARVLAEDKSRQADAARKQAEEQKNQAEVARKQAEDAQKQAEDEKHRADNALKAQKKSEAEAEKAVRAVIEHKKNIADLVEKSNLDEEEKRILRGAFARLMKQDRRTGNEGSQLKLARTQAKEWEQRALAAERQMKRLQRQTKKVAAVQRGQQSNERIVDMQRQVREALYQASDCREKLAESEKHRQEGAICLGIKELSR